MLEDDYNFWFLFGKRGYCTYCGEPADTIEHLIPWSFISKPYEKRKLKGFCTYACRECNELGGNKLFLTFEERLKYVTKRIEKKYKKYLLVVWDKDELNTLNGNLKKYVRGSNSLNLITRRRLSYRFSQDFEKMFNEERDRLFYDIRVPEKEKCFLLKENYIPCEQ